MQEIEKQQGIVLTSSQMLAYKTAEPTGFRSVQGPYQIVNFIEF